MYAPCILCIAYTLYYMYCVYWFPRQKNNTWNQQSKKAPSLTKSARPSLPHPTDTLVAEVSYQLMTGLQFTTRGNRARSHRMAQTRAPPKDNFLRDRSRTTRLRYSPSWQVPVEQASSQDLGPLLHVLTSGSHEPSFMIKNSSLQVLMPVTSSSRVSFTPINRTHSTHPHLKYSQTPLYDQEPILAVDGAAPVRSQNSRCLALSVANLSMWTLKPYFDRNVQESTVSKRSRRKLSLGRAWLWVIGWLLTLRPLVVNYRPVRS